MDRNGSHATAQSLGVEPVLVSGSIFTPGDRDFYRVDLPAGETLEMELIAGRDETPLIARLTLLTGDGGTILQSSSWKISVLSQKFAILE